MSLLSRFECPRCGLYTGYAGLKARQSELRQHLACKCGEEEQLTDVRGDPLLRKDAA